MSIKQRGQKIGDQLYQFALRYARKSDAYNMTPMSGMTMKEPFASIKDRE